MRIGLLYPARDAVSAANWSGTPRGLAGGLEACGVEVVPIGAGLPPGIHQAVAVADRTPVRQIARTWALSRRVAERAGSLDAVLAMGTEMYDLAAVRLPELPVATYDDGTLMQMWGNPDSDIRQSGFPEDQVRLWFARQSASSRAASVCCVSTKWAARSFVEDYGVAPDRIQVVGMGHRPRSAPVPVERAWGTPRFLFIGVDWQRKNGDAVVGAFKEVRKHFPNATLDVVGRHPRLDVPGVVGHGFLSREDAGAQALLDDLFASATAFVLPSRFDPSPIACLEAASAGLPVIATSEGGAGELLGEAAITVHPTDQRGLVEAMSRLCNPVTARAMGAQASRNASSSSWADVARRVLDALDEGRAPSPRHSRSGR
jgi:glycosyltransferase involved in cell wall biosynthesis